MRPLPPLAEVSRLTLPWPPSLNRYYRHTAIRGQPRTLISEDGREYRRRVQRIVGPVLAHRGRLAVSVLACPPDRRARDLDNTSKALLDALTHAGVWGDDSLIDVLMTVRGERVRGGRVVLRIEPMGAGVLMDMAAELAQACAEKSAPGGGETPAGRFHQRPESEVSDE